MWCRRCWQQFREQNARMIDKIADTPEPAFEAGMPAAIIIKIRERKPCSFDGVPPGTRIYDLQ